MSKALFLFNWLKPPKTFKTLDFENLESIKLAKFSNMLMAILKLFPTKFFLRVNPIIGDVSDSELIAWGGGHFGHPPEINERVLYDPILLKVILKLIKLRSNAKKNRPKYPKSTEIFKIVVGRSIS